MMHELVWFVISCCFTPLFCPKWLYRIHQIEYNYYISIIVYNRMYWLGRLRNRPLASLAVSSLRWTYRDLFSSKRFTNAMACFLLTPLRSASFSILVKPTPVSVLMLANSTHRNLIALSTEIAGVEIILFNNSDSSMIKLSRSVSRIKSEQLRAYPYFLISYSFLITPTSCRFSMPIFTLL